MLGDVGGCADACGGGWGSVGGVARHNLWPQRVGHTSGHQAGACAQGRACGVFFVVCELCQAMRKCGLWAGCSVGCCDREGEFFGWAEMVSK